jgi:hypothetical protein
MPVSPFQRAMQEPDELPSESGPTHGKKKRKDRQAKRKQYQELREDLQLSGDIPTMPEGAIRDERVDPSTQGTQPMSQLIMEAIRKGWEVDDDIKPELIQEMVKIVMDPEMSVKAKIGAFQALRMADQAQWERDNPTMRDRGASTVNINVVCVGEPEVEAAQTIRVEAQQLPG